MNENKIIYIIRGAHATEGFCPVRCLKSGNIEFVTEPHLAPMNKIGPIAQALKEPESALHAASIVPLLALDDRHRAAFLERSPRTIQSGGLVPFYVDLHHSHVIQTETVDCRYRNVDFS